MKDSRLFAKHGDNHVHHWNGTLVPLVKKKPTLPYEIDPTTPMTSFVTSDWLR